MVISFTLFTGATLLFLSTFLSDKLYAQFVMMWRNIKSWHTFQDLQCLVKRLMLICPYIGMPAEYPGFLRFVFNAEYYLYRNVIIILDSKIMLAEFMADIARTSPDIKSLAMDEHDELIEEAVRIHDALQATETPKEFSEIVETYRRVSRELCWNART